MGRPGTSRVLFSHILVGLSVLGGLHAFPVSIPQDDISAASQLEPDGVWPERLEVEDLLCAPPKFGEHLADYAHEAVEQSSQSLRREMDPELLEDRAAYWTPIARELKEQGVPLGLSFVVLVESSLDPQAVSHAGATGPWQFMSTTGRHHGLEQTGAVDLRRDPIHSTRAAAEYLTDLHDRFDDWLLALAAYNAGPGRVEQAFKDHAASSVRDEERSPFWSIRSSLPSETRAYVPRVLAMHRVFEERRLGEIFCAEEEGLFADFDRIVVPGGTSLEVIAEATDLDLSELARRNPALISGMTPAGEAWLLRLPPGSAERVVSDVDWPASPVRRIAS